MCGIVYAFDLKRLETLRPQILEMSKLRHRGLDWSGIYHKNAMGHERLAIVDPASASSLVQRGWKYYFGNGETYNHLELRKNFRKIYF